MGVLAVLLVITLKGLKKFNGEIFLYYLLLYGIGRFWIEGLRTISFCLPVVNLPVSQLLSIVLAAVSLVLILVLRRRTGRIHRE